MWLGVEKPCKIPCICLSLRSVVKSNNILGTQEACMGIDNLSTITLKNMGGLGMHEVLRRKEGVPSLCRVSGYCGVMLAYSQVSYPWSSWKEPLVCIGEESIQAYLFL